MMLNHLCIFLLCLPTFLATILDDDPNKIDPCPYSDETFLNIITLSNTVKYIDENDNATAACYKEIEEEYKEALNVFVDKMTEASCKVGTHFPKAEKVLESFPFLAALEIKDLGIKMREYYLSIQTDFDQGKYESVKKYEESVKMNIYPMYDTYVSYLKKFKIQNHAKKTEINDIIGQHCNAATSKLVRVALKLKKCMDGRLNITKVYLDSLKEKEKNNKESVTILNSKL